MEIVHSWLCSPGQGFSLALCILKATPHHPPLNEMSCSFLRIKYWQPGALRGKVSGRAAGITEMMQGSQPVVTRCGIPKQNWRGTSNSCHRKSLCWVSLVYLVSF